MKALYARLRAFGRVALVMISVGLAATTPASAQTPADVRPQAASTERSTPVATSPEKKAEAEDTNEQYRHSAMVQKLGGMMGMNAEQAATAFEVFNFAVLALLVGYGLFKMLPKAFRARNTSIQKNLVDARTATEEANARLNAVEARLGNLDAQIAGMRTQAEQDSARDEQRIKASVEDEKAKILAAAEAEIQSATVAARRELQQYAAELAIDQAAQKLVVTAEMDRLLVQSFAHRLGSDKAGQN